MRHSLIFAVAIAMSVDAAAFRPRQLGTPDVSKCGLDAFEGHTAEALLFCSSILRSGTATSTVTRGDTSTTTSTKFTTTMIYPSSSRGPTPTPTPTPSSTPKPSSTPTPVQPSSTPVASPSPTSAPGCGIVAYVKTTPAYYFESSGTKNTFPACSALCKSDAKCKSLGYGEANCMLFDVNAADNTNYNPMSPYTFYDASCPSELPVQRRQLGISLGGPDDGGGITIWLDIGGLRQISSACSCLITSGPAGTTVTRTATSNVVRTTTVTGVVTRTGGV